MCKLQYTQPPRVFEKLVFSNKLQNTTIFCPGLLNTCEFVNLSQYFWSPKMGGLCGKSAVISKRFTIWMKIPSN